MTHYDLQADSVGQYSVSNAQGWMLTLRHRTFDLPGTPSQQ